MRLIDRSMSLSGRSAHCKYADQGPTSARCGRTICSSPRSPQAGGLSAGIAPELVLSRDEPHNHVVAPLVHAPAGSARQRLCLLSALPGPRPIASGIPEAIWSAATVRASLGRASAPGAPRQGGWRGANYVAREGSLEACRAHGRARQGAHGLRLVGYEKVFSSPTRVLTPARVLRRGEGGGDDGRTTRQGSFVLLTNVNSMSNNQPNKLQHTWNEVVLHALRPIEPDQAPSLAEIYARVEAEAPELVAKNPHWRDKVRQVVQRLRDKGLAENISKGHWIAARREPSDAPQA